MVCKELFPEYLQNQLPALPFLKVISEQYLKATICSPCPSGLALNTFSMLPQWHNSCASDFAVPTEESKHMLNQLH